MQRRRRGFRGSGGGNWLFEDDALGEAGFAVLDDAGVEPLGGEARSGDDQVKLEETVVESAEPCIGRWREEGEDLRRNGEGAILAASPALEAHAFGENLD